MRRLEHALHVKLVKRTPKGVELTAEGSVLLLRARELRLSLQGVEREIADIIQGRVGHLRIGVSVAISEQFLSVAFATLLKDAPRTKLIVSVSDNDLMVSALCNGELDLIIHYLPVTPPEGVVCTSVRFRICRLRIGEASISRTKASDARGIGTGAMGLE